MKLMVLEELTLAVVVGADCRRQHDGWFDPYNPCSYAHLDLLPHTGAGFVPFSPTIEQSQLAGPLDRNTVLE
jgi:hypothetical protein